MRQFLLLVGLGLGLGSYQAEAACRRKPVSMVIAFDNSNAITKCQFMKMKNHALRLIDQMKARTDPENVRIGVHTFGSIVFNDHKENFPPSSHKTLYCLKSNVSTLPFHGQGNPDIGESLEFARGNLETEDKMFTKIYVLFSSGKTSDIQTMRSKTPALLGIGAHIFVITVGTYDRTSLVLRYVANFIRNISPMGNEDTFHKIEEKVVEHCNDCYQPSIDMAFMMDNTILDRRLYPRMKKTITRIISQFSIGQNKQQVRVAVVSYGKSVYTNQTFTFDQYQDSMTLSEAIQKLSLVPSDRRRDQAATANYVIENIFNNARPNARKIVLVLADRYRHFNFKHQQDPWKKNGIMKFDIVVTNNAFAYDVFPDKVAHFTCLRGAFPENDNIPIFHAWKN